MNPTPLERQLSFLREIDQLKRVLRMTPLLDRSRRENSAEHSWHLAMYALILAEHAAAPVDVLRVVKMLLVHDIVEIDAGDAPLHDAAARAGQAEREQAAARRIFSLLPPAQAAELRALWDEFEAGASDDARFARSLDRLQPLLHNTATGGGTWVDGRVSEEQVMARYGPAIQGGAPALWAEAASRVRKHFHPPASNPSTAMLRIENLGKRYGDHAVFQGLTHTFGPGCVALCEQESTGKSSLLAIAAGVLAADEGEVWIAGHSLAREPRQALARLAYVPDDCLGQPGQTGIELLRQTAAAKNVPLDEATLDLARRLGLEPHLEKRFDQMSTGTRRKVFLAAAALGQPAVVIADGPDKGLDAQARAVLADTFANWARDRVVLFASHDPDLVRACGARVAEVGALR